MVLLRGIILKQKEIAGCATSLSACVLHSRTRGRVYTRTPNVCVHTNPQVDMYVNENSCHLVLFKTGLQCKFYQLAARLMPQLLRLSFALRGRLMGQRISSASPAPLITSHLVIGTIFYI